MTSYQNLNNKEILCEARFMIEGRLKQQVELDFQRFPLTFSDKHHLKFEANQPLPQVPADHLQDIGNKSTIIYWNANAATPDDLHKYVWDKWTTARGRDIHKMDLEFSRFFAKYIALHRFEGNRSNKPEEVLALHEALLSQREEMEPEFEKHRNDENYGMGAFLEYNNTQYEHFIVQPLLRAIIIIIEEPFRANVETGSQMVRLLNTGKETGLSAPINFKELGLSKDANTAVVPFEQAMNFLMRLEDRECGARPCVRDPRIVDKRAFGLGGHDMEGFEGPVIGPSTIWIKEESRPAAPKGFENERPAFKLTKQSKKELDMASGGRTLEEKHPHFFR